jgi:hypothetical protein
MARYVLEVAEGSLMAAKGTAQKILDLAGKFVTEHDGAWNHAAWETLVQRVQALGVEVDDEGRRNLGNILEAAKHFHREVTMLSTPPRKGRGRAAAMP